MKRTIVIESDPPGARVWINEKEAGATPLTQEFITHGRYKFRLRKAGFEEVATRERVRAPVYQWIPLDFIAEFLVPIRFEDKHHFRYALTPKAASETPAGAPPPPESPEELKAALEQLEDLQPEKRRIACLALARRRDPAAFPDLLDASRDPDPTVRVAGLEALRAVGGPKSLDRLVEALQRDPDPEVRWRAATEMEALADPAAVPKLIQALEDKHPLVRAGSAEALKGLRDPRAVQPLIRTLRDKDTTARRAAAEALGLLGDRSAVAPLIRALRQHDFQTRRRAVKSLGQLKDPSSGPALARTFTDWDPEIRNTATYALTEFGDARVVPLLIRYLRSWKPETRTHAAVVLGALKDARAVKPLKRASVREPNEGARIAMQEALARLGARE